MVRIHLTTIYWASPMNQVLCWVLAAWKYVTPSPIVRSQKSRPNFSFSRQRKVIQIIVTLGKTLSNWDFNQGHRHLSKLYSDQSHLLVFSSLLMWWVVGEYRLSGQPDSNTVCLSLHNVFVSLSLGYQIFFKKLISIFFYLLKYSWFTILY